MKCPQSEALLTCWHTHTNHCTFLTMLAKVPIGAFVSLITMMTGMSVVTMVTTDTIATKVVINLYRSLCTVPRTFDFTQT